MEKYRLYVYRNADGNGKPLESERFIRITPGYTLVYSADEHPDAAGEVTDRQTRLLSGGDRAWLANCNMRLITERLRGQADGIMETMDRLEAALAAEAEKLREKGGE